MDEQRRNAALEALADEATRQHDAFVAEAGSQFVRFSYAGPTAAMAETAKRLASWLRAR